MTKRRANSGPPGDHPPAPAFRNALPSTSKAPRKRRDRQSTVEVTSVKTDDSGKLRAQSGSVKTSKRKKAKHTLDAGPSGSMPQDAGVGVDSEKPLEAEDPKPKRKRKSTKSSVKLAEWLPERDTFLDELLRHDGIISEAQLGECGDCKKAIPSTAAAYRCQDCFDGLQFRCSSCARAMHLNAPFHRLEKWSGSHLIKATTRDLDITFQLGHDGGSHCSKTTDKKTLLVIHTAGVFKIYTQYCDCEKSRGKPRYIQLLRSRLFPSSLDRTRTVFTFEVLDMFQELNIQGKTTVYDYYRTLLRQTDFLQLEEQASQLSNLHRAIRLWRHLHALKRAGRGHDPAGPAATSPGELVVECPACPHPGKNLPDDWRNATTLAFLYTMFLAVDANFKLKCKERGFEDLELGSGWGVFVNEYLYQLFLKDHRDEPEINTCDSEHDAILRAAIRCTPGYAVTGAGLVICSRHCLVRPNGAGDLQRGERYCNMDYIVFSALVGLTLMRIVLTYDIACQWSRKYRSRMEKLPEALHLPAGVAMDIAIPSWHINGHGQSCQDNFHVGYLKGVGRLCGDEVEQMWWGTNPLGTSVREMTSAARHETLNEHWNGHNSQKIVGFRKRFRKNLVQAVEMEALQSKNFEEYDARFKNNRELVDEWTASVTAYENAPEDNPNPYVEIENTTLSFQQVRLDITNEEDGLLKDDPNAKNQKKTMLRFLTTGLELEEQQRALQKEVDDLPKRPTAKQKADLRDKQNTLHRRILAWRETQRSFIPGIDELVADAQQDEDDEDGIAHAAGAEAIPLMLPSALPPSTQALVNRIVSAEGRLREAQAEDAISEICRVRRIITGLTTFKKYNFAGEGNKANTRVRSLYNRLQAKIQRARVRYNHARECLMVLDPHGSWASHLLELKDEHIKGPGRDPDESHGRHQLTWIWLRKKNARAPAVKTDVTVEEVDECERVEWCKAQARAQRWKEEVQLIKEEMRRVVVYFHWKADWWEGQGKRRSDGVDIDVVHGLKAYSAKQASYCRRLAADCLAFWLPTLKKMKADVSWAAKYQPMPGSTGDGEGSEVDSIEKDSDDGEDEGMITRTAEEILLEMDG